MDKDAQNIVEFSTILDYLYYDILLNILESSYWVHIGYVSTICTYYNFKQQADVFSFLVMEVNIVHGDINCHKKTNITQWELGKSCFSFNLRKIFIKNIFIEYLMTKFSNIALRIRIQKTTITCDFIQLVNHANYHFKDQWKLTNAPNLLIKFHKIKIKSFPKLTNKTQNIRQLNTKQINH